ncbi:insecticidal toxin complex protein TccC [Pseudomonas migulae]|uniref:RHS repeat domain-containing protein n=1 Tax=Pseudomonas migulae TaxID=78543 RepID=UPI00209E0E92|nr:RHS repeat-associated core domain-containing protein [Pseudomonas migulae]MCP1518364.1 insecticidal toxin complex protein TccC [Pseudomonas migulae]
MPTGASSYAHTGTPTMVVSDARGLLLRTVQFHRREAVDPVDTRVTQQGFDAVGRLTASRDPYLFDLAHTDASAPFNLSQVTSLSGGALMTDSVDAGWRVALPGDAGQPLDHWDSRGSHSLTEYDELLRPVAVRECGQEVAEHTLERFTYADAGAESAVRNLCGQPIRHDDPAGTVHIGNLSITGNVLSHTRKFLTGTDAADWPADLAGRDALHEPGDGATTAYTFAPGSELLSQTDAFGNVQAFAYTLAGQLENTRLTLTGDGQVEKLLVHDIRYNVTGQIEAETAGNGVITRHRYDEANGRLTELSAHKADGTPLQDLKYHYDAVGNVLSIEDAAQPIRYFANQRIAPLKTYRYDTLYQLIEATGCEAKTGSGGPALPDFQSLPQDPSQLANYTQTFYYDAGGNLLDLVHVGAQAHGRTLTRARYSNRCLPERDNRPPTEDELANGFDANGNLRELQAGQSLTWDLRNQLREVRPVVREDKEDDCECYIYDGGGQRVRKVRSSLTNARAVLREVRYLPGVEVRSHSGSGEILHVITANTGSNSVQVLHWVSAPPDPMIQDQVRYSLNDHLKSSALELDQNADLISQEWYYAFGGTAYWAGRNTTEVKYKTVRYSGKERDATGLYYYGFRYYAPWLQRWINPDPAWAIDGLNFYRMVRNNPIALFDTNGLSPHGDLARMIMASSSFNEYYEKNPERALSAMSDTYLENGHDPNVVAKAISRVREKMTPSVAALTQKMDKLAVTTHPKLIRKPSQEYIYMKEFKAIYATTHGSHAINAAMRKNEPISLSGKKIIRELTERFGDQKFSGSSGKDAARFIEIIAKGLNLHSTEQISYQLYKQANESTQTYFRGQILSPAALEEFRSAEENGSIVYSKSFLSVAKEKETAVDFMRSKSSVLFIISGFSAANVVSAYSASTVKTRVFTPHADFKVTGVGYSTENKERVIIKLSEVRGHTGSRIPMPY